MKKPEDRKAIVRAFLVGLSMETVGYVFGLPRDRVEEIIRDWGQGQ